MARTVSATEAKATLLALLDAAEAGEEIEITRHGRLIARLVPVRGGAALKGKYAGLIWSTVEEDELMSMGDEWTFDEENLP